MIDPELLQWYREKDEVIFEVVPHSHLDYAWYRDRESSKMREIEAFVKTVKVDRFTLEQMITAKEFVEGGGKQIRQDLLDMIREGRMELISMYTQPDVFLSPQELEFWNFEFGEKVARELGGEPSIDKYLPDSFGQPDTAPMVAKHAGKRSIISMRGFEHDWPLFMWESPDGSRMPTFMIPGGYANAGHLTHPGVERDEVSPDEYYAKQVDAATVAIHGLMNRYGKRYKQIDLPHLLVMNGNDFTKPDEDLPEVLEGVQEKIRDELGIKNFQIRTSSLGRYVDLALRTVDTEKLPTYRGEMRHGKEHYVLRGIDSARMYLKQRMHEVETRIYDAGVLVSLVILARNAGQVGENDHASWQQVVGWLRAVEQIQPVGSHDTISGCGSDDAYPLPLSLMTGAYNSANQSARNAMAALGNRLDTYGPYQHKERGQTFANLLPYDRTVLVEVPMEGELEHDGGLRVVATYNDGRVVTYPAQLIQKVDTRYAVCALPMRAMSSVQVRLEQVDHLPSHEISRDVYSFETPRYTLDVLPNGTVTIVDKHTGSVMKGLVFEDQGDRGDEYNFCFVDGDAVRTTKDRRATVRVVNDGPVFTEIQIDTELVVPEGLDGVEGTVRQVETRSTNMVIMPISTRVRLYKNEGIDRIEFATTIDNTARDHRVRVRFDAPNAVDSVRAKGPYGLTTRSAVPIQGGEGWMESMPIATTHNQGVVTAGDLTLYNRGLPEHEALTDESGMINEIALTLFRSVGYLSRGNLATRPGWAGPGVATPEAQMIGKNTYEFAVGFGGEQAAGDIIAKSYDYFHKAEHGFAGANINGLFDVTMSRPIEMPALRPTADGQAVIARFSNPDDEPVTIQLSGAFANAVACTYDGTPLDDATDMHEFVLPRGIVSVRLS